MVDKYLEQGLRLNLHYRGEGEDNGKTLTNLMFGEIVDILLKRDFSPSMLIYMPFNIPGEQDYDDTNELSEKSLDIVEYITSKLVLRGGKIGYDCYHGNCVIEQIASNFENDIDVQCKEVNDRLKDMAYKSILNKSEHPQRDRLEVGIDNGYFYVKYAQDSVAEPAQITNNQKIKDPELRVCVLQIGESTVRIESVGGKRDYTDISGSIEMSFVTKVGKIGICFHCSEENSNEIKVEFADEKSKARFDELEDGEKKSLWPNCLLGGKIVAEVIGKSFERNSSASTKSTEVIEQPDIPSTLMQISQLLQKEVGAVLGVKI